MTPLILACASSHAQAAKGLVDFGADVRAVDKEGKGALWHLYHPSLSLTMGISTATTTGNISPSLSQSQLSHSSRSGQGLVKIPHIAGSERVRGNPNRLRSANSNSKTQDSSLVPGIGGKEKESEGVNSNVVVATVTAAPSSSAAERRGSSNVPKKGMLVLLCCCCFAVVALTPPLLIVIIVILV